MSEFDKIIGYKDIKTELIRLCDIIKNPDKYKELGVASIGGLLLDGVPGVGKTLMANCFIKESGRKAFICRKNKPNAEFINEIRKVFAKAVENAPSIILLDDMDKFANEDRNHRNAEEYVTVQSCIDEIKGKDVFVLATTNGDDNLPSSLLRAGRFDNIIKVGRPQGEDAVEIVRYYLSQKKVVAEVNAEDVARLLNGESCATLETIINMAGQYAGFANKDKIESDDIIRACLRVLFKAPESFSPYNPIELKKTAYHEAGHAVVAEILEEGSITLISVRKSTSVIAGFTSYHSSDSYWESKKNMENRVISLLAGKAAMEIVFGEVDMGTIDDLRRAFNIVDRFVDNNCSYGFEYWTNGSNSSGRVLAKKEERVIADIELYYATARKILIENKTFLEMLAERLQEKDTLVSSEIIEIKYKAMEKDKKINKK